MTYTRHPVSLVSLTIIRTRPEGDPRSAISSITLFTVARHGRREASFQLEHRFFDPTDTRAEILQGATNRVPQGAELLIRQPHRVTHDLRHSRVQLLSQMPATDAQTLVRALKRNTILPVHVDDRKLRGAGVLLGLKLPDRSFTSLSWRSRAPLQAQALWGLYTAAFCSSADQRALFAAFHAWRIIESAKAFAWRA